MTSKVTIIPPPPRLAPVITPSRVARSTDNISPAQGGDQPGEGVNLNQTWSGWLRNLYNILRPGISVTIVTAKLTGGGVNGSMTFQNGILIAQTPAT